MTDSKADIAHILAPALYILNKTGNKLNKHKLFKILYFADKEHIAKYGRTFTGEPYIAMANGPVPSRLYDYIKLVEGKNRFPISVDFVEEVNAHLGIEAPYWVISRKSVNMDFLSQSAIKSLDHSIITYKNKSFVELTELSHDGAWKAANQNTEMSIIEIAKDAGANEEMISYIKETL
jgi:uncharacterized phage-associated protein